MFDFRPSFEKGLTYDQFFTQTGSQASHNRWTAAMAQIQLTSQQLEVLGNFRRKLKTLCMAAAWCGDCMEQCPILGALANACPLIELRFVDQTDARLADELVICAAPRIPQVVFLDEDGNHVGRYGDRTLSTYRKLNDGLSGRNNTDSPIAAATQDWLDEIERIQCLLRTSPRLRRRHGD